MRRGIINLSEETIQVIYDLINSLDIDDDYKPLLNKLNSAVETQTPRIFLSEDEAEFICDNISLENRDIRVDLMKFITKLRAMG